MSLYDVNTSQSCERLQVATRSTTSCAASPPAKVIQAVRLGCCGELHQFGLRAVDRDGVGVDVQVRRLGKLRQRLDHDAGGAEQFRALVGYDDGRPPAGREVPLNLVGEVMDVH